MASTLNTVPTPWMTFTPQANTPTLPPSGSVVLFLDGADHLLYLLDSAGALTPLTAGVAGHGISSGNASNDFVRNGAGRLILSGSA